MLTPWMFGMGGCQLKEVSKRLGANVRGDYKKRRKKLLDRIQEIDKIVEDTTLESDLISERCKLEGELEKIMDDEESYWQRRGGEKWVLKRDNNTIFLPLCQRVEEEKDYPYART
jgi:hypothetical protein